MSEMQAGQGPMVETPKRPLNLWNFAQLNRYGSVTHTLHMLIANGELSDYDDELANRVKDAIDIVEGVCCLARREGWKSYEDEQDVEEGRKSLDEIKTAGVLTLADVRRKLRI